MKKIIELVSYDLNWPHIFETEAALIKQALGDNCLNIHHIGSTSVPGLLAKPIIDIITIVKNGDISIEPLERIGFIYKGEWNIPFKFGFTKRGSYKINLHVFEEFHPEIELNIIFRNHLRSNPESLYQYAKIKESLLTSELASESQTSNLFSEYNLGKDNFIRSILIKEGYVGDRFLKVAHYKEWEAYHKIRKKQIFDPLNIIYDPNHPTIHADGHYHFIICHGVEVATVAHVEFLNEEEAALRPIATSSKFQRQGYGKMMIESLEKWLKRKKIKSLKMHALLSAENFYRKLGYENCHLDGISVAKEYINLGKIL